MDALIRACLAAPADQAPRLVLADWLDERNDPRGPALRVSHDLSFGELPETADRANYSAGQSPDRRLAARLALIAYERRQVEWKIPPLYLTACELAACRLIGPRRRDDWLRGPYQKMTGEFPFVRYPGSTLFEHPIPIGWYQNTAALLMRACGFCHHPFGYLCVRNRPTAFRILHAARFWIYTRMFEATRDDRGTWWGYRRFTALPNGRRVHGDRARVFLDPNGS